MHADDGIRTLPPPQVMETLEPLHAELALSPAVVEALREREAALITLQNIEEDLEKRQRALAQLQDPGGWVAS